MKSTHLTREQIQERITAFPKSYKYLTRIQIRQRIEELAISIQTRHVKNAVRG
jgi:hypothetical protein